jgi:hypothetical protein
LLTWYPGTAEHDCSEVIFDVSLTIRLTLFSIAIILLSITLYSIIKAKAYDILEVLLITYLLIGDLLWSLADVIFYSFNTNDRIVDILFLTFGNCTFGVSITFAAIISYWARIS